LEVLRVGDIENDLAVAERTFRMVSARPRGDGAVPDEISFSAQLQFLLTIGYLTKEQATVLFDWFHSQGMTKLPALPGPEGGPSPNMYEILSTKIHFGTPAEVRKRIESAGSGDSLAAGAILAGGIGDFFSSLLSGVADAIGTVLDGVTATLQAGAELLQAGAELVHQIHDIIVQES
jgi:hypothetical protein